MNSSWCTCIGVPGHVTRHLSKEIVRDYYAEETAKVLDPLKATLASAGITATRSTSATAMPPRKSSPPPTAAPN